MSKVPNNSSARTLAKIISDVGPTPLSEDNLVRLCANLIEHCKRCEEAGLNPKYWIGLFFLDDRVPSEYLSD
jgi:hypothetical protein